MDKTIVAIGGGQLRLGETLTIDRQIVALTGKSRPRALFIPTASGEPPEYTDIFWDIYGDALGCHIDTLLFKPAPPSLTEIADKILGSDLIYVGGGNTLEMMRIWRTHGVDVLLREAWQRGTVMAGLSAGSICWFETGYSDSTLDETGQYCVVGGLGFVELFHCPHYDERPGFDAFMQACGLPALAIDNNAAVLFQDDRYTFLQSDPHAAAWLLRSGPGGLEKTPVDNRTPRPLAQLLEKSAD